MPWQRFLLLFLAGAVISLAIAWSSSPTWFSPTNFFGPFKTKDARQDAPYWSKAHRIVPTGLRDMEDGFAELEDARGWPFRCVVGYSQRYIDLKKGGWVDGGVTWAFDRGDRHWREGPRRVYPLRPILPGLLLNSILFGCVMWVFTGGIGRLRRGVRARRGRCIQCGYDLRGKTTEGCSECGYGR